MLQYSRRGPWERVSERELERRGGSDRDRQRHRDKNSPRDRERPSWGEGGMKGSMCVLDLSFAHVSMTPCVFLCLFVV